MESAEKKVRKSKSQKLRTEGNSVQHPFLCSISENFFLLRTCPCINLYTAFYSLNFHLFLLLLLFHSTSSFLLTHSSIIFYNSVLIHSMLNLLNILHNDCSLLYSVIFIQHLFISFYHTPLKYFVSTTFNFLLCFS